MKLIVTKTKLHRLVCAYAPSALVVPSRRHAEYIKLLRKPTWWLRWPGCEWYFSVSAGRPVLMMTGDLGSFTFRPTLDELRTFGMLEEEATPVYPVQTAPSASQAPADGITCPEQPSPSSSVPARGSHAGRIDSARACRPPVVTPLGGKAAPAATVRRAQAPARVGSAEAGARPPQAPPPQWRGPARRCGAPVASMGPGRAPPAPTSRQR